jgi:CRISPR-associated endoribonuclease Cas6
MRIYLHLSPNKEIVPFNYQQSLVGAFHKWLGENELHDDISLYSLSWLTGGKMRRDKRGLDFRNGAQFSISAPNPDLLQDSIRGIFKGADIRWGMKVEEVRARPTPDFGEAQRFMLNSPILIKRKLEGVKQDEYYLYDHPEANKLMTETLQSKLAKADLSQNVSVRFDPDYRNPQTKMVRYKSLGIQASMCPVIVEGDARAVSFAWECGVGNSTGIGFGCLV